MIFRLAVEKCSIIIFRIPHYVSHIEKSGLFKPYINKRRLHPRQNFQDLAFVYVPHKARVPLSFYILLNNLPSVKEGYPAFLSRNINYQFRRHSASLLYLYLYLCLYLVLQRLYPSVLPAIKRSPYNIHFSKASTEKCFGNFPYPCLYCTLVCKYKADIPVAEIIPGFPGYRNSFNAWGYVNFLVVPPDNKRGAFPAVSRRE